MAAYHSHLEGLIKARAFQQEVLRRELLEQENLLNIETGKLREWMSSYETALKRLKQFQKSGATPQLIQEEYEFIRLQSEKIKFQRNRIQNQQESVDLKRHELSEVVKEKKIVEKIEARQKEAFYKALNKKETLFQDEIAGRLKRSSP